MADIPPGIIEDGSIKDPEPVADAIRQLYKTYNIKEHNVAISIGGYSVIVKKINVQTMSEEQLQETIHFEAEQYIPFDISDVNLDFQILGENEQNPNQMSVLLVAAKKEMIDDYINLTQLAGLNPCIIDVDAFALQNIFESSYDLEDENVALIDIGASKTSLNILKGATSVFMRDVSLGCGQINQKITSLIDCTPEEAEQLKFGDESEKISQEDLSGIVSSVVADWCTEIRRALDFFYSTYPDDQIKKIVLSGGGGNIKEFRQLLAVETSAEVQTINPFESLHVDDDRFDIPYIERIAPQASICLGLALRKVNDK
jgi:type IV pilus assembly protein PilM